MSGNMKDSGTPWIGKVPHDWSVLPIKRSVHLRKDRRNDYPATSLYVGLEDVEGATGKYLPTEGSSRLSEDSTVGLFEDGDVLYGKLRPYLRKSISANFSGACSTEFLVMKPFKVLPDWLNHWLLTTEVTQQIEASCEGAKMPRADWESISSIPMPVPTLREQGSILNELDRATTRIDALVATKTRFIELLREKRQALITHAVTKGLDPGVPMKDSGVEWLGEVPAHWNVVRGSAVFVECTAKNDPLVSEHYLSLMANVGIIPYEEKGDVGNKKPEDVRKCKLVEPGDFVLNSMNYAIGSYGVSRYSGVCSPVYVVMKHQREAADPKFLDLILSNPSYQNYAQSFGTGILDHRRAIGWDEIKVIRVPLPPRNEQKRIAAWAISRRERVDTLIAKTERSIELLREHRTALITAAVTGKLDLRATA